MEEQFLGGIASVRIYRRTNPFSVFVNSWGYGIYFTENRLIGVSYRKITSQAFRPAYVSLLIYLIVVASGSILVWLIGVPTLDIPLRRGLALLTIGFGFLFLGFMYYLSPKRASKEIERITVTSIQELEKLQNDVLLDRNRIWSVRIGRRVIKVRMQTGQTYTFVNRLRRGDRESLMGLIHRFCAQNPSIFIE